MNYFLFPFLLVTALAASIEPTVDVVSIVDGFEFYFFKNKVEGSRINQECLSTFDGKGVPVTVDKADVYKALKRAMEDNGLSSTPHWTGGYWGHNDWVWSEARKIEGQWIRWEGGAVPDGDDDEYVFLTLKDGGLTLNSAPLSEKRRLICEPRRF